MSNRATRPRDSAPGAALRGDEVLTSIWDLPVVPVVVALTLVGFAFAFVRYFLLPANGLGAALEDVARKIDAARAAGERDLSPCFAADARLAAIWQEYRETLHTQRSPPSPSFSRWSRLSSRSTG